MDLFFNECRAYGRLIDKKINGKVAVRYGYLMIPAKERMNSENALELRPGTDLTKST
jgi:hypothetical protein